MSIVRVGLAETKKFSEGYEAIFGKKEVGGNSSAARAKKPKSPRKKGKKGKK